MSINNPIFEHYRKQQRQIQEAKQLLEKNGFTVNEKNKAINQEIHRLKSQLTGNVSEDVNTTKERANSRLKECCASRNSAQVRRERARHQRSSGKVATVCSSSASNSEPANNARVVAPDKANSARSVRVAAPPRNHGFVVPSSSSAALSLFASLQATTTAWATTSGLSKATLRNSLNQGLVGE